jgi:hypothetical protein
MENRVAKAPDKARKDEPPKRLNRAVGVNEALRGVLDAALKKRGFATRDILTHWAAMAPRPYDTLALPDQLKWPRGAGHEGATLYLRCAEGQRLALAHEGELVARAVNRYFGYFLVREVRLSAAPFSRNSAPAPQAPLLPPEARAEVSAAVAEVDSPELKEALRALGEAMHTHKPRKHVTKP